MPEGQVNKAQWLEPCPGICADACLHAATPRTVESVKMFSERLFSPGIAANVFETQVPCKPKAQPRLGSMKFHEYIDWKLYEFS
jgi:hypothetical protein